MHLNPSYLMECFAVGARGDFRVRQHRVGAVRISTNYLVACDPLVCPGEVEAFSLPLPVGRYPVVLTLATRETDTRVAFARLVLADRQPITWDLLTTPEQNPSDLGEDEFFGYGVDTGAGCFCDQDAAREIESLLRQDEHYSERLIAEMERTYSPTWSAFEWTLPSGLSVVCFSSGYGDGLYPTYVGLGTDDEITCVVTDFQVLAA